MLIRACAYVLLIVAVPVWAQVDASSTQPTSGGEGINLSEAQSSSDAEDQMVTPTPVSIVGLPIAFSIETPPKNYLRGGFSFESSYVDPSNLFTTNARDIVYSLSPTISFGVTRPRAHWDLSYSPDFTIYQRNSELNRVDHDLAASLEYRLGPHVTLGLQDTFVKAIGYLMSPFDQSAIDSEPGVIQKPNDSIVPALTDRMSNLSQVAITYQFSPNSMLGANGTLWELWYGNDRLNQPGQTSVLTSGLFGSGEQAVEGFYTRRLSKMHYIGANLQFQKLLVHPRLADTQTESVVLFYTLYLRPTVSLSVFAGPQLSDTTGELVRPLRMWSPEDGASFGYQGAHTTFVASYGQRIGGGGGLAGAVRSKGGTGSVRRQLPDKFTLGLTGQYATNRTLTSFVPVAEDGHTVGGSVSLQHPLGDHLGLEIGYARLHQTYKIPAISNAPNQTRAWASISYQFERALGR